ncbi:MAG: cytochrome b/b6 domain-containing protein [Acidiphilium sp.]|nr:cytochrome b/b6 domain-containing protein [Acidiphilium sp.]MDD4936752.1 cytochrome b/b6 domain-containing protein [Acidiphilium sp.]
MPDPVAQTRLPMALAGEVTSVRVWDPIVRIFHWTVVLGVVLDYSLLDTGKLPHRYVGYVVAGALVVRILWGFIGSPHARFADFVVPPRVAVVHLWNALRRRERRYIGHNPAGGVMMLGLMGVLAITCLTGWMQGLDAFWGIAWVQRLHGFGADLIVAMAVLHVTAALAESVLHRENLVLAMITGRKRAATGTDIDHASAARRG